MSITISAQTLGEGAVATQTGSALSGLGSVIRSVSVISVEGDLDVYTAQELRADLRELLGRPGWTASFGDGDDDGNGHPAAVVVDLRPVTFMDSYALGVLVLGYKLAKAGGIKYALVSTDPIIERLFAMTGVSQLMPLHPDVTSALEELHAG